MNKYGDKEAANLVAAIRIVAPRMARTVAEWAIQAHGGGGVCDDTSIAETLLINRYLRIADGPDEVRMNQLGRIKIKQCADR